MKVSATAQRLRASVICEASGHLLLVRLRDPLTGIEALFPPGGRIEPGETPAMTAERETLEETGLAVRVDPGAELVDTYPFRWAGMDYEVTTHYLGASLEDAFDLRLPEVIDATYNLGAVWLPVAEALTAMAVHPAIAAAAARVLAIPVRRGPIFGRTSPSRARDRGPRRGRD